jgi:hypothetical protein
MANVLWPFMNRYLAEVKEVQNIKSAILDRGLILSSIAACFVYLIDCVYYESPYPSLLKGL